MKYPVLALTVLLAACSADTATLNWGNPLSPTVLPDTKNVQVLGRTWAVAPMPDQPAVYTAVRDNNNNNPFGKPVARRTPQALRAIELATGCQVVRSSMKQDITARFYASVVCKS